VRPGAPVCSAQLILPRNSLFQSGSFKRIRRVRSPRVPLLEAVLMRILNAALLLVLSASPALAQRVPSIVIPGRPDVPVMMNGIDVSWSVVEGDYGLDRPIGMVPTVIYRPYAVMVPGPGYGPPLERRRQGLGPAYFPRDGRRPGYGRLEVEPPPDRPLPPPAESFFQGWGSQSTPGPVTQYPPFAAPPIVWNGGGGWGRRR
jgi:hypothetical protein